MHISPSFILLQMLQAQKSFKREKKEHLSSTQCINMWMNVASASAAPATHSDMFRLAHQGLITEVGKTEPSIGLYEQHRPWMESVQVYVMHIDEETNGQLPICFTFFTPFLFYIFQHMILFPLFSTSTPPFHSLHQYALHTSALIPFTADAAHRNLCLDLFFQPLWSSPGVGGETCQKMWLEQLWLRPHSFTYSCTGLVHSVPFFLCSLYTFEWCISDCSLHCNRQGDLCQWHCKLYQVQKSCGSARNLLCS